MNVRAALSAILAVVVMASWPPAMAERVSIRGHSQDEVKQACSGDGDVSWTSTATTGPMAACMPTAAASSAAATRPRRRNLRYLPDGVLPVPKLPRGMRLLRLMPCRNDSR